MVAKAKMPRNGNGSAEDIAALVRKYLEKHQPPNYRLEVRPDGIEHRGNWWYVVVSSKPEGAGSYDFYDRLARAELDLEDREKRKILLVPVMPPEDD